MYGFYQYESAPSNVTERLIFFVCCSDCCGVVHCIGTGLFKVMSRDDAYMFCDMVGEYAFRGQYSVHEFGKCSVSSDCRTDRRRLS
jgi:hypothetical protein